MKTLILYLSIGALGAHGDSDARWGRDGHRIVCDIAWNLMSEDTRAFVSDLLDSAGPREFVEACIWADDVRRTTHRHTSAYHYVNLPPGAIRYDEARDCSDTERRCVSWAIPHYLQRLRDQSLDRGERSEALKFVMHFVGDLHQPLHAGYGHDLGGNRHTVMIDGDSLNLHWIWDSRMMERAGYEWQSTAAELLAEISDSDRSSLATADVVQWTNESFQLVESFVYTHEEGAELDLTYESEALAIIRARLAAAGIRLAFVLDAAAAASGQ